MFRRPLAVATLAAGLALCASRPAGAGCENQNQAASCFTTEMSTSGTTITIRSTLDSSCEEGPYLRTVHPANADPDQCDTRTYLHGVPVNTTFTFAHTPGTAFCGDYDPSA